MDSIIFDVDGTLWDSRAVIAKAWNQVIKEHSKLKIEVSKEMLTPLFGKPIEEITDAILPNVPEEKKRKLESILVRYENEVLKEEPGVLYDGVKETIITLSKEYPLYLASNCFIGYIDVFLEVTNLKPYFKDFISYGDTGLSKGDNLLLLIEKHGLKDPIYIGDMQGDGDASKKANIPIVYAEYGFGKIENPDYVIYSPKELIKLCNKIKKGDL